MNNMSPYRTALFVAAVCVSAFLGARSVAQEMAVNNYERDAAEFDRTRDQVAARVAAAAEAMKQAAREAAPEQDSEDDKKARNAKIEAALQSLVHDAYGLVLQAHLLALDSITDRGGAMAEGHILGVLATKFKVPIAEVVARREKTGLGLGGVFLGYAIARAAEVPADEIFTNKAGSRTWLDVMSHRQVGLEQIRAVMEDKKP